MDFYIALAGALMGALSLILHAVGKRSAKAESLAEKVDEVDALLPKPAAK